MSRIRKRVWRSSIAQEPLGAWDAPPLDYNAIIDAVMSLRDDYNLSVSYFTVHHDGSWSAYWAPSHPGDAVEDALGRIAREHRCSWIGSGTDVETGIRDAQFGPRRRR